MIKPARLNKMIGQFEFVPQAIIAEPINKVAKRLGSKIEEGHDDLDEYQGAAGWLDGEPFALMHYKGHPRDTSTIYLPFGIQEIDKISEIISRIASDLELSPESITWQRKDNPEL